ncbi:Sphingosine N-acyltransferase LAG1 [Tolypocladium ophioglossoides CBS 100239]|uniref:Sphingosine N-acyltransferase LAG1 n=1 Tax=Tolypocladium ophioglossoides (strain CBS 100239) TaxID=1163406 RepID=A0A0L0NDT8_TOLOC|nr:Sphingosine N-acyltransferase LAG1 [Tolypocladium ophioglossoides CBS 100239]
MAVPEPSQLLHISADKPAAAAAAAADGGARRRRTGSRSSGTPGAAGTVAAGTAAAGSAAAGSSSTAVHRKGSAPRRRKPGSRMLRRVKRFAIRHTWTLPLLLLLAFAALYAVDPGEASVVRPFIFLSYKQPLPPQSPDGPPQYGKGPWDLAFVAFYTIVLSFTREFVMQQLLRPLARAHGLTSRGKQQRFMEQAYTALYFAFTGPAGVYVMRRTPVWYFDTRGMYEHFPHTTHEAAFKFYYLFQAAYWAQQALVMLLGMEKPRKDFKELVAHHIVTLALIALSYCFHFTYIGIAVYLTHDVSDLFLALSKSLNYIGSPVIGPFFGLSIAAWIYLRHYLNLRILYSVLTEFRTVGPYELDRETEQYKCWVSNVVTFGLLAGLQTLNLFWLYCLLRSAYRFVVHNIAKDDRSEADDETDVEELDAEHKREEADVRLAVKGANGVVTASGSAATEVSVTKRNGAL